MTFTDPHQIQPSTPPQKVTGFLFSLVLGIPRRGLAGFAVSSEE